MEKSWHFLKDKKSEGLDFKLRISKALCRSFF